MTTKTCPFCYSELHTSATVCRGCGAVEHTTINRDLWSKIKGHFWFSYMAFFIGTLSDSIPLGISIFVIGALFVQLAYGSVEKYWLR